MFKVFQFYLLVYVTMIKFFKLKNKYIKKELKEHHPDTFYLKLIYNKYKNYTTYLL
jgi:hypothetical protein